MLKIDLHGLTYAKVEDILPEWIITNYNNGHDDFEIITGNSFKMKNLVKKICSETYCNALPEIKMKVLLSKWHYRLVDSGQEIIYNYRKV